jgi:cytochrome b561
MDPFGYWLLGYCCIVGALLIFRWLVVLIQPWVSTPQGESFMEEACQTLEHITTTVTTLMFFSVPVGAVYACYCLGADLAERWGW